MTTTIIVVRHANTFEGRDLPTRIGHRTDLPIVSTGVEQCAKIGQYLKTKGYLPSAVCSSMMTRSRQTAQEILKEMRLDREIHTERMLNEIDYGPDENQPESVIIERMGGHAQIDEWNRHGVLPIDWEGDVELIKQNWKTFASLVEQNHHGKAVLVVTHSGVGRFSLAITGEFERMARNHSLTLSMGGISIFEKESPSAPWKVKEWNVRPKGGMGSSGFGSSRRF